LGLVKLLTFRLESLLVIKVGSPDVGKFRLATMGQYISIASPGVSNVPENTRRRKSIAEKRAYMHEIEG